MEVALANPSVNPVSAGLIPPGPQAGEASRLRDEAPSRRTARREADSGSSQQQQSRELVPRTQTALYTSQARRGIAVYEDTASFTPYQLPKPTAGIDLYV